MATTGQVRLRTERLCLRPWTTSAADAARELAARTSAATGSESRSAHHARPLSGRVLIGS